MILSLGAGEEFADVVVAEALPQAERARLGAIAFGRLWRQNRIEADAQGKVDDFLEGLVQFRRALFCLGGNIRIERQVGSHLDIMMLYKQMSTHI